MNCDFSRTFALATGNTPFPWQTQLYQRFLHGDFPSSCNLPTGLGKTSIVAIWLIALAAKPESVPRRLVYVVNRRTVVDQTTHDVEALRSNLAAADLLDPLRGLSAINLAEDEPALAISTLRGQFADNREWSSDPARPAVIVGTVDMIGSRMLFSGYGIAFKSKPHHAGLLGQDVLLIHDEAHLEPAFQSLILDIQKEQVHREQADKPAWRKLHVMELTATASTTSTPTTFELTEVESDVPEKVPDPPTDPVHIVWKRLRADKAIQLVPVDETRISDEIVKLALTFESSGRAVLIFVRTVEDVIKVVAKLKKQQVAQLTGTLRGLERDELPADPRFARFLPEANRRQGIRPADGTVFLVCTSAGEVGVNISADDLVCDLTTFESMAQRFGRVNRFGDCTDTDIYVVHPKEFDGSKPYEKQRRKTLELLMQLDGDVSPVSISKLDTEARIDAFAPTRTILPVTDILFDSWAMTSIRERLPGRPTVEPYLHGIADWEPPDTYVAWREEVDLISDTRLTHDDPDDLLGDYPLKPHELLREPSHRAFRHFQTLAKRHPNAPVWLLDDQGSIKILTLGKLADKGPKNRINYRTVLLPPSAGGLRKGILDGTSKTANDVADEWFADPEKSVRRRIRLWDEEPVMGGMRLIRIIDTKPDADELGEEGEEAPGHRYWNWYTLAKSADDDRSKTAVAPIRWEHHTRDVTENAQRIVTALDFPQNLKQAIILAAKLHDLGKKRVLWQRSIGNPHASERIWYAKSGRDPMTGQHWRPLDITRYRHEFGSLLDATGGQEHFAEFDKLSADMKDVVLHLIAAHHGRGRPHFPRDESFDPERPQSEADALVVEVPRRFARLQRKFGRWGLAYLESLLRAADHAASDRPSAQEEVE